MAWKEQLPAWRAKGAEPPADKKKEGWNVREKPPADYFNWLHHQTFQSLQELRDEVDKRILNDGSVTSIQSGKESSRPVAGTNGAVFIANDTGKIFYDNGTTWDTVAVIDWDDIQHKPSVFPPEKHAASHASDGDDPITPADIGAVNKVQGKGLSTNDYTDADQQKLEGIEKNANHYTHPDSHPASMITETTERRFVSDQEKEDWNSKETPTEAQNKANTAEQNAKSYTDTEVGKINVPVDSVNGQTGKVSLSKLDVGLSNLTNDKQATKAEFDNYTNKTVANSEIHGLRVNSDGELEFNNGKEWKQAYYVSKPGSDELIAGDKQAGFFGEVPASNLFTGSELASAIGITQGTIHNDNVAWIKYTIDGKTCFRPLKSIRYGISYDEIERNGCVDGTTTVQKNGMKFKVRLMSGATQDSASDSGDRDAPGSEWNQIMLPISEKAIDDSWEYPDYVGSDVPVWKHGFGNGTDGMYTDDDLGFVSGDGYRHWCQEHSQNGSSRRVSRGRSDGPSFAYSNSSDNTGSSLGWAPCLELIE